VNRIAQAAAMTVAAGAAVLGAAGGAAAHDHEHGRDGTHGHGTHGHGTEGGGVCASDLVPLGLGNSSVGNRCG
jgi:hypothetical protein